MVVSVVKRQECDTSTRVPMKNLRSLIQQDCVSVCRVVKGGGLATFNEIHYLKGPDIQIDAIYFIKIRVFYLAKITHYAVIT